MTSESATVFVLSHYPLTAEFKAECQGLGRSPEFASLTQLRQMPLGQMFKRLRAIDADLFVVAADPGSGLASLPLLRLLAFVASARQRIEKVAGNAPVPLTLWRGVGDLFGLAAATLSGAWSTLVRSRQLVALARRARISVPVDPAQRGVVYLNCNLWFGLKAGGSVGHISGVANALMDEGYGLQMVSASGRLLVKPTARFVDLVPPPRFSFPLDLNYYRFDRACVRQLEGRVPRDTGFLYQRMSIGNITGVLLSRRHKLPLVIEYNGSEVWVATHWGQPLALPRVASLAETVVLKHAHLVVTVSDVLRDELIERGVEPSRVVAYPNCIDPEVFDPARFAPAEMRALRERHGIAADACVVTFLGTFGQWHGAEVLAEAARHLWVTRREELARLKLRFLLIGDGAKMPNVRRILESEPGLMDVVHLTGLVPQAAAPAYLAMSDVLASPHVRNPDGSRFFGSPTKLFEYMAMGKAIVASRLDQIAEVLTPACSRDEFRNAPSFETSGQVGLLVEPGDAAELADALVAVAADPARRARLGANARSKALSHYTWRHHVHAILARLTPGAG